MAEYIPEFVEKEEQREVIIKLGHIAPPFAKR